MPPEIAPQESREGPGRSRYERFVQSRIDAVLGKDTQEGGVGNWYREAISRSPSIRISQEPKLAGEQIRVEKKGSEIAKIYGHNGITVEGYNVKRVNPNGTEFAWLQPALRRERKLLTVPTETGLRQNIEASSAIVIVRDPQTGEVLLTPKQDTFATTQNKVLIGTGVETNLDEIEDITRDKKRDSELAKLLHSIGGKDSLAQMVRKGNVEFVSAPPTDANRTTEKPMGVVINVTGPQKEAIKKQLTQGTSRRWCSEADRMKLSPVLDGGTASMLFATAGGNSIKEYEFQQAKRWFNDRLRMIGSLQVAHADTVTNGNQWKVASREGVDEGVNGGHFLLRRVTEVKQLADGRSVKTEKLGMLQAESEFSFPTNGGEVTVETSGIVGLVRDTAGRVLLSVEPEPLVIDPGTTNNLGRPSSPEFRGLLRTMQFSSQKLKDLLAEKNVDIGLKDFFDQIKTHPQQSIQDLFKSDAFEVSVLPPADADSIKATNIQLSMIVKTDQQQKNLTRDGSRRWFTMREAIGLAREGKVNAHTSAALFSALRT